MTFRLSDEEDEENETVGLNSPATPPVKVKVRAAMGAKRTKKTTTNINKLARIKKKRNKVSKPDYRIDIFNVIIVIIN